MPKSKSTGKVSIETVTSLQQLLKFKDSSPKHLLIQGSDIGGELLPILSKGLYTNPLDCIREYVQNGVDAGSSLIRIKVTGNSVTIYDEGTGMNMEELVEARKFGVSSKLVEEHVGFRGIGIYSGYDLCNRLVIRTKQEGDVKTNIMRFEFGNMKNELERVRKERGGNQLPLNELLTNNTSFSQEDSPKPKAHFTMVQLEDISPNHIYRLRDRAQLRQYILQNLPVDFDYEFEYRNVINEHLKRYVPKFRAVRVILQSDDADDELVVKPNIIKLKHPTFGVIQTGDREPVAYYWACLKAIPGRLDNDTNSPVENERAIEKGKKKDTKEDAGSVVVKPPINITDYQGFVYKTKGFTIGNRDKLLPYKSPGSGTLYRWYTGEVYVLDTNVVPNAGRDDFETSPAKAALETAVGEKIQELIKAANKFQQESAANDKVDKKISEFNELQRILRTTNPTDIVLQLGPIIADLKKQKSKASADKWDAAQAVLKKADKLLKDLRASIDRDSSSSRRQSAQTSSSRTSNAGSSSSTAANGSSTTSTFPQSLTAIIEGFDFSDPDDLHRLLKMVDDALIDVLGKEERYYMILGNIEGQLQAEFNE